MLSPVDERDVARVSLLGAESTGKTTLAQALAEAYATAWVPEYGRVYTELGRPADAPWTSWEFTHIARVQCWWEDFLAGLADRVLFCDTDAFTTAVFHEAYLGSPATEFAELAARPYDLYLVCGPDVPWARDGIREFDAAVSIDVRQRVLDVDAARAALDASEQAVAAAAEARRVVEERFNAGVATSTDVLDAQLKLVEAELERTELLASLRIDEARLVRAVGGV